MKIFFPVGRLGNHLYQFIYVLSKTKKNEVIITSYSNFFDVFDFDDRIIIKVPKYVRFFVRRVFNLLRDYKLIGRIHQNEFIRDGYTYHSDVVSKSDGYFTSIHSMDDGYFMADNLLDQDVIGSLAIKEKFLKDAQSFIKGVDNEKKKIFIHVRRGDYKVWGVLGNTDTTLPISYYKKYIEFFRKKYDCFFIVMGDDYKYMEEEFSYLEEKLISKNNEGVDLSIMSLCDGAIISPSTFSFWGAYLMNNSCEIIAPKYWLGFKDQIWFPFGTKSDRLTYKEIE